MRVAVLVTGGKDSALALYRALRQDFEVKHLVTMIPQREDSWMFHSVNIHLTDLFAEAVGIPLARTKPGVHRSPLARKSYEPVERDDQPKL
jgi:diphthine-ammonia ligase